MKIFNQTPQIEMIQAGNVEEYKKCLPYSGKKKFETMDEFNRFCLGLDLKDLFGFSNKLNCIFHEDKTDSASVYKMGNDWLYTCHSTNCNLTHQTVNIFGIMMMILECNYREAQAFLMNLLNCEVQNNGTIEPKAFADNNLKMLDSMPEMAPTALKIIGTDIQVLRCVYEIVGEQKYKVSRQNVIIGESTRYIQSRIQTQVKVSRALAIFAYFGFIRRIPLYELEQIRMDKVILLSKKSGQQRLVSQMVVKQITEDDFAEIEAAAMNWNELYKKYNFTYKTICEKEGVFKANLLFPQK